VPGEASAGFASAAGVVGLDSPVPTVPTPGAGAASAGLASAGLASVGLLSAPTDGVVAPAVVAASGVAGLVSGLVSCVGAEVVVVTVPVVSVDSVAAGSLCGFCVDSLAAGVVALSDSAAGEAVVVSGAGVAASLPVLDAGSANVPPLVNESRRAMAVEAKNRSTRIPDITNSPCEPVQRRSSNLSERLLSIYGGRRGRHEPRLSRHYASRSILSRDRQ
jgi:hypothetical protein